MELNVVKKDWRRVSLRMALCYPSEYRVGMSGLTIPLLYWLFNSHPLVACERVFHRVGQEAPKSLESGQSLRRFDVVAFTLQYEEDYVNVVSALKQAKIPPRRRHREGGEYPLIIAGGPCAAENPLPLSEFVDAFVIGEVEPIRDELVDALINRSLEELASVKGVYVPGLDRERISRVYVKRLDDAPFPTSQLIVKAPHGHKLAPVFDASFKVEVSRGCPRSCRFCLIKRVGAPFRLRSLEKLVELIDEGVELTRVGAVSLIGAAVGDYPKLLDLIEYVVSKGLRLTIPSIRADAITEELAKLLSKGGERVLTIAPETGSEALREALGKDISDEELWTALKAAKEAGFHGVKMYFMVGVPGETSADVDAIVELARKAAQLFGLRESVRISVAPLVPKPHTPLENYNPPPLHELRSRMDQLRKALQADRRVVVELYDPRRALIQSILSRADSSVADVIEEVVERGGGLGAWRAALRRRGLSLELALEKWSGGDRPWGFIKP